MVPKMLHYILKISDMNDNTIAKAAKRLNQESNIINQT